MAEAENNTENQTQAAPDNTGDAGSPAEGQTPLQVPADQAKKAAEQLAGGVMQGMDKLKQTGVTDIFKKAVNQPPVTMEEKLWAGISYIPLVALVALVIKPDSAFIRLHGRQGLLMFLLFFICIFVYLVPFVGPAFGGLIQLVLFILGIFSMYQALVGNWWKIPVIGDLAAGIPLALFEKVTKEVVTGQPAPQEPVETRMPEVSMEEQQPEQPAPAQPEQSVPSQPEQPAPAQPEQPKDQVPPAQ